MFLDRYRGVVIVTAKKVEIDSIDISENTDTPGSNYEFAQNGREQSGGSSGGLSNNSSYTYPNGATFAVS